MFLLLQTKFNKVSSQLHDQVFDSVQELIHLPLENKALVLEVCDETDIAELKMKIGDNTQKLKQGLAQQGTKLSEYEVQQLMEAADADRNGTIDYNEFIIVIIHMN